MYYRSPHKMTNNSCYLFDNPLELQIQVQISINSITTGLLGFFEVATHNIILQAYNRRL